jgi:Mitochondrial ribosomal death-associated protein 3
MQRWPSSALRALRAPAQMHTTRAVICSRNRFFSAQAPPPAAAASAASAASASSPSPAPPPAAQPKPPAAASDDFDSDSDDEDFDLDGGDADTPRRDPELVAIEAEEQRILTEHWRLLALSVPGSADFKRDPRLGDVDPATFEPVPAFVDPEAAPGTAFSPEMVAKAVAEGFPTTAEDGKPVLPERAGWVHTVLGASVPRIFPEGLGGGMGDVAKFSTILRRKRRATVATEKMYADRDARAAAGEDVPELTQKEKIASVTIPRAKSSKWRDLAAETKLKERNMRLDGDDDDDDGEDGNSNDSGKNSSGLLSDAWKEEAGKMQWADDVDDDEGDVHTIVRSATLAAWRRLEGLRGRGFLSGRLGAPVTTRGNFTLLTGPAGCGKSAVLSQMVAAARLGGWIVWHVPNAKALLEDGGYILPSPSEPGVFEQPILAMRLARELLAAHEAQLREIKIKSGREGEAVFGGNRTVGALREEWLPRPESDARQGRVIPTFDLRGHSLADLLRFAATVDEHSAPALALFRRELGLITSHPVLVAVDAHNALYAPSSTFQDPLSARMTNLPPLRAQQLSIARTFIAPDAQGLVNGTFLGAVSCGRGSGSPSAPWASLRRMHEARPDLLPEMDARGVVPGALQASLMASEEDHFCVHVAEYRREETEAVCLLYKDLTRFGLIDSKKNAMPYQNRNFVHSFTGGVAREVFDYAKVV